MVFSMSKLCYVTSFFIFLVLIFSLPALATEKQHEQKYYPLDLSLTLHMGNFYGFFDRHDVFFDVSTTGINHAGYGGEVGLLITQPHGFGIHFITGYQRLWYADIGIQEIKKNYIQTAMLFYYKLQNTRSPWRHYGQFGPAMLFSKSGNQGYLRSGIGVLYKIGKHWLLSSALTSFTDFTGVRGQIDFGIQFDFD